jgi:hypothetical protein
MQRRISRAVLAFSGVLFQNGTTKELERKELWRNRFCLGHAMSASLVVPGETPKFLLTKAMDGRLIMPSAIPDDTRYGLLWRDRRPSWRSWRSTLDRCPRPRRTVGGRRIMMMRVQPSCPSFRDMAGDAREGMNLKRRLTRNLSVVEREKF